MDACRGCENGMGVRRTIVKPVDFSSMNSLRTQHRWKFEWRSTRLAGCGGRFACLRRAVMMQHGRSSHDATCHTAIFSLSRPRILGLRGKQIAPELPESVLLRRPFVPNLNRRTAQRPQNSTFAELLAETVVGLLHWLPRSV